MTLRQYTAIILILTGLSLWAQTDSVPGTGRPPAMEEPVVTVDLQQAAFADLVRSIEEQSGWKIYYREEWTGNVEVDIRMANQPVSRVLEEVLARYGLYAHILRSGSIVVLPLRKLENDFSHLFGPDVKEGMVTQEEGVHGKGKEFMDGSRPEQIVPTIVVGSEGNGYSRTAARIRGRIRNLESGEPVIGATMVVSESGKGSISDEHGIVTMSLPQGRYAVQFSFIGMETFPCRLDVRSDGEFTVEMQPAVIALNEVQIVGSHYRDINSTDVGVERLSMSSVKQLPLFMGENDVIKISRLLPGITSAGEASVGVNVRGGNADQNIFYINRIPVYNTSHMFGFLSAFNSDIVQDFSVYKGNVPVNYGGRLSSVFNIVTRRGGMKSFGAHAGISPVSAHATIDGPLIKEKASFLLSGRTSYSDWMLKRLEDPVLRNSNAYFYDFSGSLSLTPDRENDLHAFYYQSADRFAYGEISQYEYANRGGSLVWKHLYSPSLSSTITGAVSDYTFANTETFEVSRAYRHRYRLRHNEVVAEYQWVPALNHSLQFGGGMVYYSLDRGQVNPYGEGSLKVPVDLGMEQGVEGSLFLSDNITVFPWLSLYAGLRYSFYSALGPRTVRRYLEGMPVTEESVIDSVLYDRWETVSFDSGPEIRAAMNIKTGRNTSFKLSFSQMRQYLFMLSNTITISPTDQWKLSDRHISPPSGNQYTAGFYHILPRWGISGSIELYYKETENLVEYRDGAGFIGSPFTEISILQGIQEAYGAEFMLQKSTGRLDGWISYSYSRSFVQVRGWGDAESINRGEPYPSNFDRPHVLNLIGSYHINRRFTISSNMVYMSGRPVTFPNSLYFVGDQVYIDYYQKNQVRVPDYFRIDASISIEGNLKADKMFHSSWSLNVYNALGRKNPQSIFFEPQENYLRSYSFSVIGVPIVTLSWNIKMGNYETR